MQEGNTPIKNINFINCNSDNNYTSKNVNPQIMNRSDGVIKYLESPIFEVSDNGECAYFGYNVTSNSEKELTITLPDVIKSKNKEITFYISNKRFFIRPKENEEIINGKKVITTSNAIKGRDIGDRITMKCDGSKWYVIDRFGQWDSWEEEDEPLIIYRTVMPTTGYKKGTICYKTNVFAGGYIGWINTGDENNPNWKSFGLISDK